MKRLLLSAWLLKRKKLSLMLLLLRKSNKRRKLLNKPKKIEFSRSREKKKLKTGRKQQSVSERKLRLRLTKKLLSARKNSNVCRKKWKMLRCEDNKLIN